MALDDIRKILIGYLSRPNGYQDIDVPRIMVHEFKPYYNDDRWFIRAYLISGSAVFISVHPAL